MLESLPDIREILGFLVNPTSNQQYVTVQYQLMDLYKEPGKSPLSELSHLHVHEKQPHHS